MLVAVLTGLLTLLLQPLAGSIFAIEQIPFLECERSLVADLSESLIASRRSDERTQHANAGS